LVSSVASFSSLAPLASVLASVFASSFTFSFFSSAFASFFLAASTGLASPFAAFLGSSLLFT